MHTPIRHVHETCLCANDLEAIERFYTGLLGLRAVSSMGSRGRVFRVNPSQVIIVFDASETRLPHGTVPSHGTTGEGHVALAIETESYDEWIEHLQRNDVAIEKEVTWPSGARSIYFRDPGGNSLELVAGELWPA